MPFDQSLTDALIAIDGATTRLGTSVQGVSESVDKVSIRVDKLVQDLGNKPTAAEIQAFKDAMDAETTKLDNVVTGLDLVAGTLNNIAKDPSDPIPPDPVIPPVDPEEPVEPVDPEPVEPQGRR